MSARLRVAVAVMAALVVLAGCRVDVSIDVAVQADGSGTITLTAVADQAVVNAAPGLANDLRLNDARNAGWTVTGPEPTDAGGLRVVLTHPFGTVQEATAILTTINGDAGPLHDPALGRVLQDGKVTFSLAGTLRIDGDLAAFADVPLMNSVGGKAPWSDKIAKAERTKVVGVTLRVTLPGAVTSAATRDGDALVWTAPYGGNGEPLASSSVVAGSVVGVSDGPSGFWRFISTTMVVLLVAWLLAAGAFIAYVVQVRRRQARRRDQLMAYRARNLGSS